MGSLPRRDTIRACLKNLNTWDMFWTNQVQMKQGVVGKWLVGGGLQMLLGLWLMLGFEILNVLRS